MTPRPSLATAPADPSAALSAHVGTLLGVWAHPDDEAYLSAALMALARRHGQRVVVDHRDRRRARHVRSRAVAAAVGWPGAAAGRWRRACAPSASPSTTGSGYPDGGCTTVPAAVAVEAIGRVIDAVRPDTIVTFGPDGMTGHPDHIAVSDWTTEAWQQFSPAARLWYATQLSSFHDQWGELNDRVGLFADCPVLPSTPHD